MTLTELASLLSTLNIPVAYSHFKTAQTPPFIAYIDTGSDNFGADNKVYAEITNVDIELYTTTVNRNLENQIKQLLSDNDLYYNYSRTYIETEKIYKITYEVFI